jgi:hypothetical protein
MGLGLKQKFKGAIDGKAFRVYEVTHAGEGETATSVSATSLDLNYIEAIVGVNNNFAVQADAGSFLMRMCDISITGDHTKLVWQASTIAGTQTISVIGW